jgi:hypothetical protein
MSTAGCAWGGGRGGVGGWRRPWGWGGRGRFFSRAGCAPPPPPPRPLLQGGYGPRAALRSAPRASFLSAQPAEKNLHLAEARLRDTEALRARAPTPRPAAVGWRGTTCWAGTPGCRRASGLGSPSPALSGCPGSRTASTSDILSQCASAFAAAATEAAEIKVGLCACVATSCWRSRWPSAGRRTRRCGHSRSTPSGRTARPCSARPGSLTAARPWSRRNAVSPARRTWGRGRRRGL